MNYRSLGRSGLKVSALSLGFWVTYGSQVGFETAKSCMMAAYEHGVNFFDNAEVYAGKGAEEVMGKIIADMDRSKLVISSKLYWPMSDDPNDRGLSRKHIMESVEGSLKRLGTDYLDMYFCHRYDDETPLEETVRAMDDLVHQGKVLYWGTSEWRAGQISNAYNIANQWGLYRPQVEQPQYNMFHRHRVENELAPNARDLGYGMVVWSPLASGILTGKYNDGIPAGSRMGLEDMQWLRKYITQEKLDKVKLLAEVAGDLGCTTAQLSIAWLLRLPEVSSVITGASRAEQVHENMKALEVVPKLTPDVLERIEKILQNDPNAEE
ncbi:MAG TPA: aldo/keto reductase [Chloroflexi bacterium]|nr:MAG: aldo/keto reductase [Anaerolineaceae bacterium 4572_5.2]HEY85771.1 aldo/keto reductase [Chloroflexota bacterium]